MGDKVLYERTLLVIVDCWGSSSDCRCSTSDRCSEETSEGHDVHQGSILI